MTRRLLRHLVNGTTDDSFSRAVFVNEAGRGRMPAPEINSRCVELFSADHKRLCLINEMARVKQMTQGIHVNRREFDQREVGLLVQLPGKRFNFILLWQQVDTMAAGERQPQAGDGGIKGNRCIDRSAAARIQVVSEERPIQIIKQAAMRKRDTLGNAGTAGGVNQVGQVLGQQGCQAVRLCNGRAGIVRESEDDRRCVQIKH